MRILVFGSGGQLGKELLRQGQSLSLDIHGADLPQTDITDLSHVMNAFAGHRPLLAINAAAYTDVDGAETEPELTAAINTDGPANIARLCEKHKIPFIHISTDYVFDGTKRFPYHETDPVSPIGVYGRSKADGESVVRSILGEHIIVRTAWLYSAHGRNFVKTIWRLAREKEELRVVSDQYGSPTSAADLAEAILTISDIVRKGMPDIWGTYHYCGEGIISWHEFAQAIVDIFRHHAKVRTKCIHPVKTVDYPTRAMRPAYSALDCGMIRKQFGISPKPWQDSLETTLRQILSASGSLAKA